MPVADAIEHLFALQAQMPSDPYFALWSRLADFDPEELAGLIAERKAVRMTSLRGTVHLTTAADARVLRPWVQPLITRLLASTPFGKNTHGVDRDGPGRHGAGARRRQAAHDAGQLRPALDRGVPRFCRQRPLVRLSLHRAAGAGAAARPLAKIGRAEGDDAGSVAGQTDAEAVAGKDRAPLPCGPSVRRALPTRAWSGVTNLAPVFERCGRSWSRSATSAAPNCSISPMRRAPIPRPRRRRGSCRSMTTPSLAWPTATASSAAAAHAVRRKTPG